MEGSAADAAGAASGVAGPVVLPLPVPQAVGPKLYASKGCVSASACIASISGRTSAASCMCQPQIVERLNSSPSRR